jgi:ribonuclease D
VRFIDNDAEFDEVLTCLKGGNTYFIDTEFESNRQGTALSVLQVSVGNGDGNSSDQFVLDAIKLTRLAELGPVMVRDDAVWVLHAGLQDVELLLERFRLPKPPRLFDTQIAWSLLGPEASVSLAYIQYRLLGVRSMKSHQADNWMRRPLPASQIEYAAADIKYLPALHLKLLEQLRAVQREEAVAQACAELLWPKPELPSELSLSSFRNAWQLEPKNQAALRFLIEWYNGLPAWERERAPVPKTMLSIASRLPRVAKDLLRIKGLPPHFSTGYAENLVHGIGRAVNSAHAQDFVRIDPEPYATFEEILLEGWLALFRAKVCAAANVAPDLAFPTRLMRAYKDAVQKRGPLCLPELLEGWRKTLLAASASEFVATHSL